MKLNLSILFCIVSISLFGQHDAFKWERDVLSSGKVAPATGLATDQYGRIFYIDKNTRKIVLHDPNVGWYSYLNQSAMPARNYSNLVYVDNAVYYIGVNNRICRIKWDGTSWNNLVYQTEPIAVHSKIDVISENQIFYIRSFDKLVCSYWSNSTGSGFGPLNANSVPAATWSNIQTEYPFTWYVGEDSKIHYLKWNYQDSSYEFGQRASYDVAAYTEIEVADKSQVFYIRQSDFKVCTSWENPSGTGYSLVDETAPSAMHGSNLAYWNKRLYYSDVNSNLHVFYWNDCDWSHHELNNSCEISQSRSKFTLNNDEIIYVNADNTTERLRQLPTMPNFIYAQGEKLMKNNSEWNPLGICYKVQLYTNDGGNTFFVGPSTNLFWGASVPPCDDPIECAELLNSHLEDMNRLGFNSVRFTGTHVFSSGDINAGETVDEPELYVRVWEIPNSNVPLDFTYIELEPNNYEAYFNAMEELFELADSNGLKVNYFTGLQDVQNGDASHENYISFLGELANNFKDNSAIYAYSYVLEPDHFSDNMTVFDKGYICDFTSKCYGSLRDNDPNHLITAGFMDGGLSTFSWDPGIVKCDFLTYHMYPDLGMPNAQAIQTYEPLKVKQKWVSEVTDGLNKPWIVGETGFVGADIPDPYWGLAPVNTTENDQLTYAKYILISSFIGGAAGVQWWCYADSNWGPFVEQAENHLGLYYTWDDNLVQKKIIHPDYNAFSNFSKPKYCDELSYPNTYYDDLENYSYELLGFVLDDNGDPIKNAVIRGRLDNNGQWINTETTFTDENGMFVLKTNFYVNWVEVSAVGKEYKDEQLHPMVLNGFPFVVALSDQACSLKKSGEEVYNVEKENELEDSEPIIEAYPNPGTNELTIVSNTSTITTYELYDMAGRKVDHGSFILSTTLNLMHLNAGTYIIKARNIKGSYLDRWIKQ